MSNNVHFSSSKDDWTTPKEFFDKLNEDFPSMVVIFRGVINGKE